MDNISGSTSNIDCPVRLVNKVKIRGIACAVPENISEVKDLNESFGFENIAKIIASTGVERRHVVGDETSSDLCLAAARRLISDMDIDPNSIDTLIFVSQTHDHTLPATACILQEKLGLPSSVAAFDVAQGCSGYVYGLWLASSILSGGGSKRALLLVGDTISKIISQKDRSVAALFGDAGSATLLDFDETASQMRFVLGTDGRGSKNLIVPAGAFRDRPGKTSQVNDPELRGPFDLYMNGAEIFAFTLSRVPRLVLTLTDNIEVDIKKYVFHQANKFMLMHLVKRMKLPLDKVVLKIEEFGNTSSTSIPLAISADADVDGDVGVANGYYLLAGFGVGYSWAGCVTEFSNLHISPITLVKKGAAHE